SSTLTSLSARRTFVTNATKESAAWKLGRLNHVAIAVPDMDQATLFWRDVMQADRVSESVAMPEHGVYTVFVELGNTKIELLHPHGEKSPIAGFLAKNKNGGIHHICLDVPDIKAAIASLKENGVRALSEEPKIGAHNLPVVFLHPKDCGGVLQQLFGALESKGLPCTAITTTADYRHNDKHALVPLLQCGTYNALASFCPQAKSRRPHKNAHSPTSRPAGMHMAPNAAVVSSSPELDCLRPSKPLSNLQGGASASDAAAMLETLSSSSAWAAAVVVPKERRPWNQVLRRMVQRSRAAHDPLMSPSTKDFDSFAHSVARRAECGLLESIGDAIASPLPRSETHMVGVKADCDLEVQGEGTAQGDSRSFYAPQLFSGKMDESGDVADPALCDSNVCRLAISEPSRSRAVPLAIPNIAVPTRLGDNLVIMSCSHNEIAISETGSSPASSIALGPLLLLRTIKMIRHRILACETLEGISVQY
ncbi:hypothetical protein GGF37_005741, partial [Kickxella alabastrina]